MYAVVRGTMDKVFEFDQAGLPDRFKDNPFFAAYLKAVLDGKAIDVVEHALKELMETLECSGYMSVSLCSEVDMYGPVLPFTWLPVSRENEEDDECFRPNTNTVEFVALVEWLHKKYGFFPKNVYLHIAAARTFQSGYDHDQYLDHPDTPVRGTAASHIMLNDEGKVLFFNKKVMVSYVQAVGW